MVVEAVDYRAHDLLQQFEVEEKAGFIEIRADEGDEDLVVVAVRIFALSAVVAEVVTGREAGFYGDFKHALALPFRSLFFAASPQGSILSVPFFPSCATGFLGAAFGLFKERGKNASQGDDEGDDKKGETGGLPEGGIAGGSGLLGDVGVREDDRDRSEQGQRCGENEEVAAHRLLSFLVGEPPRGATTT